MSETTKKIVKRPVLTVRMVPGNATQHQKKLWMSLWTRLTAECQHELRGENEAKK